MGKQELRRLFQRATTKAWNDSLIPATLGKAEGSGQYSIEVPGKSPSWNYVTLSDQTIAQAINVSVGRRPRLPVWLDKDPGGTLYVVGVNLIQALQFLGDEAPSLGVGQHSHEIGYGYDDPVSTRRITSGLVQVYSGMTVYVRPFLYEYDGVNYAFSGGYLDLTAEVPASASTKVMCIVWFDPVTVALGATSGDEVSVLSLFTLTDLAEVALSGDVLPLAGVTLREGQTEITQESDFMDGRLWLGRLRSVDSSSYATIALDNLASVAINTSLVSDTDATDSLGSAAIAWLKGFIKTIIAATAIAGSESSGGSLAIESTTHATKGAITFNNSLAKVDSVGEIYGRGDTEYGLVRFLVNLGTLPDGLFLTDYTPLTDFAGAPFETGNYNFNTPSVLQMYGTAVDKRQFLYKTVSISTAQNNAANAVVSAGVNVSLAGMRVDDGTDNNYLEFGMRTTGLAYGALSFYTRKRTGGGAVTTTQVGLANLPAIIPYAVRIFSVSGTNFCYIKGVASGWTFMAGESYGYTITRRGIVVTANASDTPNADFAGNFNSFEEE